jgi:hypothetical protein
MWKGFNGFWNECGMDLELIWNGFEMYFECSWNVFGIDLEWIWDRV